MKMLSYYKIRSIVPSILLCSIAFCTPSSVRGADRVQQKPVLVANVAANLLPDSVQVADIVRGVKRSWPNGTITTVVLPGRKHPSFQQMEKSFFASRGGSLQRHWLRLVFSGRGNPPLYAESVEEMCELVRLTRGSCALFYDAVPTPCQSLSRSPRVKVAE